MLKRIQVSIIFLVVLFFSHSLKAQESIYQEMNNTLLEKLIATAKANYPKMKAYQRRILMAENNVAKAKTTWFDIVSLSLAYSPTNTTSLSAPVLSGYQLGVFLNISSLLQKPYTVKQSKDELYISKLDKEIYDLNLEMEVKSLYVKYIQQLAVLKMQSKNAVDMEANYKQIKYKFEKAEESFDNYNKALISFAEQKQNIITSEGNVLLAKYSLEEIICKKLEDVR